MADPRPRRNSGVTAEVRKKEVNSGACQHHSKHGNILTIAHLQEQYVELR